MRIGISCYPTHGGSGVVAAELGKHLAERGHQVAFVSYASPLRLSKLTVGISVHEIQNEAYPFKQFPYTLALAAKMAEVARLKGLQIIHAHYAIPFAVAAILARQIAPELGLKVVTTLHGTDITLVGSHSSMRTITSYAMESSDAITAVSQHLRSETYRIFNVKKEIEVIYNFIDPQRHDCPVSSSVPAARSGGQATVMHISNFRPLKRIGDVIEVFAGIRRAMDARLLLVGDGRESMKAEQMTRDLNLVDSVVFMGVVDEVAPVLAAADLLLLPSESESFGMAALEAMASGIPVVASNVGGIPEVVEHGVTGYLARVGDIAAMTGYAVRLLSDRTLRNSFSAAAKKRAVERFSFPRMVSRYESLYERVLAQ